MCHLLAAELGYLDDIKFDRSSEQHFIAFQTVL
jgi:hypothetical protein